jgi:D-alanine transfer protein
MNRVMYYGTVPLGFLENGILRMQDHCETLFYILKEWRRLQFGMRRSQRTVEWDRLIADATAQVRGYNADTRSVGAEKGPERFVAGEQHAQEWIDFELLLRGLNEFGARPLVLSMPIDGRYLGSRSFVRESRSI